MEISAAVLLNAYIASPQHLPLLTYSGANLSLQHGNGPWSPLFYSVVVLLWAGEADNSPTDESAEALEAAQRLADILLRLLENPRYARCKSKALDSILGPVNYSGSMKQLWDLSLEIYHSGLDTGDLLFAGLGAFHLANFGIASGMNLNEYIETVSVYRQRVKDLGQDYTYRMTGIGLQTAQNLIIPSSEPDVLEERYFHERRWLPEAMEANDGLTLFIAFQAKLLLSYHFDLDGRLMEWSGETEKYLESVHGMINIGFFRFYDSLSRLRLFSSLSSDERKLAIKRVESNQLRMEIWARSGHRRNQHKYDLVEAEIARVSDDIGKAVENYERAIAGARENEHIHEEALANELYARFWQERGNDRIAEMYMREARALYHQWGAAAKVDHLKKRYPGWFEAKATLLEKPGSPGSADEVLTTITQPITSIQLDLDSITSASQLLSAETNLEQLLTKMMDLVMANSGAENAVLLLKQENEWFVQARKDITTDEHTALFHRPFDPTDRETELIPESVFNYCQRTKDVLVLGDAQLDDRFAEDHMIKNKIRSIACIPALSQGQLRAMLYLKNSQTADVFTLENVGLLQHLSAQFAVSVENVLLYDSLNQKVRELEVSEAELARHRDHLEATVTERTHQLNQRVKELDCLYGISRLAGRRSISQEQILRGVVDLLPPAMQHPEIACARIVLNGQEFETDGFQETPWELDAAIVVRGEQAGQVEIAYLEERPDADEGPFVKEERLLLDAVAGRLGRIAERKQAGVALRESEQRLSALFQSMPLPSYYWQRRGDEFVLVDCNIAADEFTHGGASKFIGQSLTEMYPDRPDIVEDNTRCFSEKVTFQKEMEYEFRSTEKDGYLAVTYAFAPPDLVIVQTEDISDRKLIEVQLAETAARAERDRLAQDLHDSVSQGLYTASFIAETLPSIWDKNHEEGRRGLKQLEDLIQGASAEMRRQPWLIMSYQFCCANLPKPPKPGRVLV
jgi:GAF domain-containing protein